MQQSSLAERREAARRDAVEVAAARAVEAAGWRARQEQEQAEAEAARPKACARTCSLHVPAHPPYPSTSVAACMHTLTIYMHTLTCSPVSGRLVVSQFPSRKFVSSPTSIMTVYSFPAHPSHHPLQRPTHANDGMHPLPCPPTRLTHVHDPRRYPARRRTHHVPWDGASLGTRHPHLRLGTRRRESLTAHSRLLAHPTCPPYLPTRVSDCRHALSTLLHTFPTGLHCNHDCSIFGRRAERTT